MIELRQDTHKKDMHCDADIRVEKDNGEKETGERDFGDVGKAFDTVDGRTSGDAIRTDRNPWNTISVFRPNLLGP
jgi:hypothetical protein